MLYHLVRPVARFVLRYYYRNIDLTGLENIPADAAVVLAANHPTAFIEPCILACFQPRTLWFLARGNLFKNSFYNALLAAVHILPVFRLEDGGYGRLKDNFGTFEACYQALSDKKAIMMLAEGRCIHEKALRPLRKGTARLALGALQRDPTLREVYVVPVGCNFADGSRARGQVMIRCGEPILASAFMEEFRRNEATAIRQFTLHLRSRLNPLVVQFADRDRATLGEARLELERASMNAGQIYGITNNGEQLDRELYVAAHTPPNQAEVTDFFNRLDRQNLDLGAVAGAKEFGKEQRGIKPWVQALISLIVLIPQLPLWTIAEYFYDTPKHIEFASPVRFAVLAGGTFLLYPLMLFFLPWRLMVWLAISLLATRWAIRQLEDFKRYRAAIRVSQLVPEERESLLRSWQELSQKF